MSDDTEDVDQNQDVDDTDNGAEQETDWRAEAHKWKSMARKHEKAAKNNADKAQKFDDNEKANQSEQEKLQQQLDEMKSENSKLSASNTRLEVALDNAPEGMSISQIRKLAKRLSGDTQEDLEADAKELFADFAPSKKSSEKSSGENRTPKEQLKSGAAPESGQQKSPEELATNVMKKIRGY